VNKISFSQKDTVKTSVYKILYFSNGAKSSEGFLKDGNPDGFWKTYYQNGKIKSEGLRTNFQLDSIWNFYDEKENLVLQINYKDGKKNGIRKTINKEGYIEETFVDDIKQGNTSYFFPDGKLKMTINFVDGREQGFCKEYTADGTIITLIQYKSGYMIDRENINRKDKNGLKQDTWKEFYENGKVKWEGTYRNDKKNGYFKEYSEDGNLMNTTKYIDDELQQDVKELKSYEIKTEYYPSGNPKIVASYNKNNVLEGVRRDYSEDGKIIKAFIYDNGVVVGNGIVDEKGLKQGPWKEFFETGQLKGEGVFENGKRIGNWKFYYKNGTIEEQGSYLKNEKADGNWVWYYENGQKLREQSFDAGVESGIMTEFSDSGTVVAKGQYIDGYEDSLWIYNVGDIHEEGSYKEGKKIGEWKQIYSNGKLRYIGKYIDDSPDGKHTTFWDNGNLMEEGKYIMGKKEADWRYYDYSGALFLTIFYRNGVEVKYDNVIIKPALDPIED